MDNVKEEEGDENHDGMRCRRITLDILIDDVNQSLSTNNYSFLRVLDARDRASFIAKLNQDEYRHLYLTKKISIRRWVSIVERIQSPFTYIVCRKA